MAARHYALTLNGSAQQLSTLLSNTERGGAEDVACVQIILAADPANSNVIYVGANNTVAATTHGFALDPTQATAKDRESIGPFSSGKVKPSDIWVKGTNAERLMVFLVPM